MTGNSQLRSRHPRHATTASARDTDLGTRQKPRHATTASARDRSPGTRQRPRHAVGETHDLNPVYESRGTVNYGQRKGPVVTDRIEPPTLPLRADSESPFFRDGHFWVHEEPDGTPLAVRLTDTGRLRVAVGTAEPDRFPQFRRFDASDPPPAFGFAARHVRERFQRARLREAVPNPSSVVFRCWAVHSRAVTVPTDTPPVVGWTVEHDGGSLLPHELVELFEAVGLAVAPIIDREIPARQLDLDGWPDSQLYDGRAVGVRYHRKGDGWRRRTREVVTDAEPIQEPAESVADRLVADANLAAIDTAGVERTATRLFDDLVRRRFPELTHDGTAFELDILRSAITERVAERLGRR